MKHITWCLLLLCHCALGQTATDLTANNGDISGNPYLFKDWCNGTVHFSSGRVLNQFKLKFDVFKNQLLLQFEGSTFAAESKINEFVMYPKSKSKDSLVFRKGFPISDKGTEHTYYQVLFAGKVQLLRLFGRTVITEHNLVVSNNKQHSRLEEAEYYYLLHNNSLVLLPGNRTELAAIFPDKKEQLAAFITDQQLKMRSSEDYVAVVKKYNELIP
jgi:hypothetical protein